MSAARQEVIVAEAVFDLASRADGFGVLELLHDLTGHVVGLLGVCSANVTVLNESGGVDCLAASDETCRRLAEDEIELDEGPCLDSTRTGRALDPVLLRAAHPAFHRWPHFTPRALRAGITSIATLPLVVPPYPLGALGLLSTARVPTREDLRLARVLADAAGASLQYRQALLAKDAAIGQLETALESRVVVKQAEGMLVARLGLDADSAFAWLRGHARSRQQSLIDLATRIVQGDLPADIDGGAVT
ncbi:GAF and ANTAR domain-containing protein [Streptomyces sp. NPDC004111]|uniref:GAF and ANTAR domain-containing protein n=1 Tax=Streptomyces sp. NPDC004111 TaxID=3364690 RepID=UPI0036A557FB